MRPLDIQRIQQRDHVSAQLLDAVGPLGHQGLAVATGVESQHTKMLGKSRYLDVPHMQVGTQGIGQHQYRCVGGPLELVMQFALGELYKSHSVLLRQSKQNVRSPHA